MKALDDEQQVTGCESMIPAFISRGFLLLVPASSEAAPSSV